MTLVWISLIRLISLFHVTLIVNVITFFISILKIHVIIFDIFFFFTNFSFMFHFLLFLESFTLFYLPIKLFLHLLPFALKLNLLVVIKFFGKQSSSMTSLLQLFQFLFIKHINLLLLPINIQPLYLISYEQISTSTRTSLPCFCQQVH